MDRGSRLALALVLAAAIGSGPATARGARPPAPASTAASSVALIDVETLATGLTSITAITHAGDGRLFLTLQRGQIVVWDGAQILPAPFLDLSGLISCCGERGLLSTAFHPLYAQNGFFFVDYTDVNGDTVIARYRASSDPDRADASSAATLLTIAQPFANHNGGQLQFGPDGDLYIGMGDGGSANDPLCNAQTMEGAGALLGKMLRIDVDQNVSSPPFYGIPAENPFVATGGPDEVWAKGLRNPWRFSFDRLTGDLFIGDVGQGAREEIDRQPLTSRGGQNYGWKVMEGTLCGSGGDAGCVSEVPPCGDPAYTPPILEYGHDGGNCTVIGGYVYRGLSVPELYGTYVYGDYCSGTIWGATNAGGAWSAAVLPVTISALTTFGEDAAGELYAGTEAGTLLRFRAIVPVTPSVASITPGSSLVRGYQPVSIQGANFTSATQVFFGGLPAVSVTIVNPTALVAVAPPHAAATVDVTVANPGAAPAVVPEAFSYFAMPRPGARPGTRAVDRD